MYANLICVINADHEHNAIIKPICFLVEVRYEQELVWQNRYLSPHYGTFSWQNEYRLPGHGIQDIVVYPSNAQDTI